MKRLSVIIIGLIFTIFSCKNTTAETDGKYPGKLLVGHLVALDMAPLFVANEAGFFTEEGLQLELRFFANPGDNNAALANGSIQFSTNPFTLPYFGNNAGDDMRIVSAAGGLGIIQVIVQGKYLIENLEDLKTWVKSHPNQKLKIGLLQGDTLEMIVFRMLKNIGLDYDAFEIVPFDDLLIMVEAFRNGTVDILSHIKPYTTDLVVNHDAKVLTDNSAIWGYGTPNCTVAVMKEFGEKYPKTVVSYLRALKKGFQLIVDSPGKAVQLLDEGNYYKVDKEVLLYAFRNQPKEVVLRPNVDGMMEAIKDMVAMNYIKEPSQQVVDLQYLEMVESGK
ncbi:MAG: ABC transporter substrate-binding protein [Bacteroidota bacterium]